MKWRRMIFNKEGRGNLLISFNWRAEIKEVVATWIYEMWRVLCLAVKAPAMILRKVLYYEIKKSFLLHCHDRGNADFWFFGCNGCQHGIPR